MTTHDFNARDCKVPPAEGDTVTYERTVGRKLVQEQPWECRKPGYWNPTTGRMEGGGCQCGKCAGVTTQYTAKVVRVMCFMDNSTEVVTSEGHTLMWEYPHGDAC